MSLKADGVTLYTRYGRDNSYLGHPDFQPVWAELSRRGATVFIHPTHPVDTNLVDEFLSEQLFNYPHETGRNAIDLISQDTLSTDPDCKIIPSHVCGTLPFLIGRAAGVITYGPKPIGKPTEKIIEEASNSYFDSMLSIYPVTLRALLALAKPGYVMFGVNYPNAPRASIGDFAKVFDGFDLS
ncbi:hypothetical protein MMC09_003726 [Bachmanniomyces sp. S44760]|nr:hypothetical protein [Bachmanniomyces sp. S44760]